MKVAIAGTGNVAQYLVEELSAYGHDVVVLTRRQKPTATYQQCEIDYSIPSLVKALEDRDALVSTVSDYTNLEMVVKVHLDLLEAVKQSKRCKTFIPSEWTLNVEDHPEQPMFLAEANKTLHTAFEQAQGVKWTIVSNSWFLDYIVPSQNRYLRDIGTLWPMDHANKVFTIYGPGTQKVDLTPVRDVAKGVAALLDSTHPWEKYTYMSGQQLTWNELFAIIKAKDPQWTSRTKPLASTILQLTENKSFESAVEAYFEIESYAGALQFPQEKVLRHREKYFPTVHFRSARELLDQVTAQADVVV